MSLESVSRNQHNVSSLETDHLNNVGIDIKELLFGKSPLDFKTLGISCRPDQTWVPLSVSLSRSSSQGSQAGGCKVILWFLFLSSPGPKPSFPKPPRPNPNQVQPSSKPKLVSSGLGLTLKSCRPPPPPTTFKHLGGVPQKVSKSKKVSEWSSLLLHKKNLLDSGRKDKGLSTMFKEDIIKLTCCTIIQHLGLTNSVQEQSSTVT